jgi:hypothetical protein
VVELAAEGGDDGSDKRILATRAMESCRRFVTGEVRATRRIVGEI